MEDNWFASGHTLLNLSSELEEMYSERCDEHDQGTRLGWLIRPKSQWHDPQSFFEKELLQAEPASNFRIRFDFRVVGPVCELKSGTNSTGEEKCIFFTGSVDHMGKSECDGDDGDDPTGIGLKGDRIGSGVRGGREDLYSGRNRRVPVGQDFPKDPDITTSPHDSGILQRGDGGNRQVSEKLQIQS